MLIDFLQPVSPEVVAHAKLQDEHALGNAVQFYEEGKEFPVVEKGTLVLFGVLENRNSINYLGKELSFKEVRKAFYELFPGSWNASIVDIGNVTPGNTVEDTYFAVKQIVAQLIKLGAIPIVLGGGQDVTYALYRAYDDLDQMVNLVSIDGKFDLRDATEGTKNNNYLHRIIVEEPNNLLNYSNLGYQTYYNSQEEIDLIKKLYFDAYRLGQVTGDMSLVEPVLRDADVLSFDVGAIEAAVLSVGKAYQSPNGFSGKEACTIARYAGLSSKITCFSLFELNQDLSYSGSMLLAQVLWYYIEGVHCRVVEPSFQSDQYFKKYIVPLEEFDLMFYESQISKRWWVALPDSEKNDNKLRGAALLSCTQQDYLLACNQEIPERIYKALRKSLI